MVSLFQPPANYRVTHISLSLSLCLSQTHTHTQFHTLYHRCCETYSIILSTLGVWTSTIWHSTVVIEHNQLISHTQAHTHTHIQTQTDRQTHSSALTLTLLDWHATAADLLEVLLDFMSTIQRETDRKLRGQTPTDVPVPIPPQQMTERAERRVTEWGETVIMKRRKWGGVGQKSGEWSSACCTYD